MPECQVAIPITDVQVELQGDSPLHSKLEKAFKGTINYTKSTAVGSVIEAAFMFWQVGKAEKAQTELSDHTVHYFTYEIISGLDVSKKSPEWFDNTIFWLRIEGGIYIFIALLAILAITVAYSGLRKKSCKLIGLYVALLAVIWYIVLTLLVLIAVNLPGTKPTVVIYFVIFPCITIFFGGYLWLVAVSYFAHVSGWVSSIPPA